MQYNLIYSFVFMTKKDYKLSSMKENLLIKMSYISSCHIWPLIWLKIEICMQWIILYKIYLQPILLHSSSFVSKNYAIADYIHQKNMLKHIQMSSAMSHKGVSPAHQAIVAQTICSS